MDILWIGLAYLLGLAVSLVSLPPLVGYLGVGFILSAFNLSAGNFLHELAHAGVLLLLFTVGLKLRFRNLLRPEVWAAGSFHFALVMSLFTVGLAAFGLLWKPAAFLAAGLAFSSTVLAAKVLEEKRELGAFHGRVAMGVLILQDLFAVGLMVIAGAGSVSPWAVALIVIVFSQPLLQRVFTLSGRNELLLLLGVVLTLAGGKLFESLGLSGELGAIVIGALLANHPRSPELAHLIWSVKEVFLVAFFVEVGLAGLPNVQALLGSLILMVAIPIKAIIFFILFLMNSLRARNAFLAAIALASYSEFALITAQVGVNNGLLPASYLSALALTVALSFALAAPLNRFGHGLYDRFEAFLSRFETARRHPDQQPMSLGSASVLICGMGRTGSAAYEWLRDQGKTVAGLDSDPAQLEACRAKGYRALYGDAEDVQLWADLRLDEIELILLTMPDLEAKRRSLGYLHKRGYSGVVAATSYFPEEDEILSQAGVNLLFNPFIEAGARLARLGTHALAGLGPLPEAEA
ncbi:MAG: potassium transporter KefC [Candidatus Entotheonella factor]|uniref:Potassium transporter KefC n=1 Tax=Entotheonella factor TaxID=1429438 RepID=W4LPG5_ENTF1|nr:cation:proton antiporter family protein [Candidatus Entotheonella palauensis]ETW99968.1 MAG: potassium transporter KefC [Candidatus Entotheonella factor]